MTQHKNRIEAEIMCLTVYDWTVVHLPEKIAAILRKNRPLIQGLVILTLLHDVLLI